MMGGGGAQHKSGGFALLVVILVMLITSFLASQLIMQVRADLQITDNIKQRVVGRMLAEGGVNLALFRLIDTPGLDFEEKIGGSVLLRGHTYETVLPTGKMEYYAVDESGKIDLNKTPFDFLKKFLEYHGLGEEEVEVVVDSLLDWRDNDDLYRVNGAEKNYYAEQEKSYIPRNGKIEDPAEFFLLRGTESLRGKFDPYAVFTVNNSTGKININNLSPDMLAFLVGDDEDLIARYRQEQDLAAPGSLTLATWQEISGSGVSAPLAKYLAASSKVSKIYSIVALGYAGDFSTDASEGEVVAEDEAEELAGNRPVVKIRVLVDASQNEFRYLSWRER